MRVMCKHSKGSIRKVLYEKGSDEMWTAGNYGERLLLARVLAQLLEAQAEVLEGQVLQGWVEKLRPDTANSSIPDSTSNALMRGALRRRIAA